MPRVSIGAFDRIHLQAVAADALLGDALSSTHPRDVQSIPLAATESASAMVVHVIPIRGAGSDIFPRADVLLLVTLVTAPTAPLTAILTGLFVLTPAEARVARGISYQWL